MFNKVLALLALFAGSAAAFAPAKVIQAPVAHSSSVARATPSMSFKSDMAKVAAVATTMMAPAAALARLPEGTNAPLGIDVATIPLLAIPTLLVANVAFNDWAQDQDNGEYVRL